MGQLARAGRGPPDADPELELLEGLFHARRAALDETVRGLDALPALLTGTPAMRPPVC